MKKHSTLTCILLFISTLSFAQTWQKVSAGGEFSLAIRSDGALYSWGSNLNGQLGVKSSEQFLPSATLVGYGWKDVDAGAGHWLGIKKDGTLWSCGYNGAGALGLGDKTQRNEPVQVGSDTNWIAVAAGQYDSYALKSDHSLWAWGLNADGEVGDSSTTERDTPVQIGKAHSWVAVAAGGAHGLAIASDGSLWTWGFGVDGQLGTGNNASETVPVQVGTDKDWAAVSGGFEYSLALKKDGSLWSWGFNGAGQLGIGNNQSQNVPMQVDSSKDWAFIAAGSSHALAIKKDSSLYGWGFNRSGQLGFVDSINLQESFNVPIRVGHEKWKQVAAAAGLVAQGSVYGLHSLGLKGNSRTICVTGANYIGQLGTGDNTNLDSFNCDAVQITGIFGAHVPDPGKIMLYPNPTSGAVTVDITTNQAGCTLLLMDMKGQVLQKRATIPAQGTLQLDLGSYPPGIYFAELIYSGGYEIQKLIRQ